jgi:phosphatidylglycerophosphatase C
MLANKIKKLALFDFDGTLTKDDTLISFTVYYHGRLIYLIGLIVLSPILLLFKLKLVSNSFAKERYLSHFFRNESISIFNNKCIHFSKDIIPKLIRINALNALEECKRNGYEIYVVSASPQNWIKPWCDTQNINCIATQLKVTEEKLTGKIHGLNCYGHEKVRRINSLVDLSTYGEIIAFGDSKGDFEMFSIATKFYYKSF